LHKITFETLFYPILFASIGALD